MEQSVALITGASGGIGVAIAKKLYQKGYCTVLQYHHHAEPAIALAEELNQTPLPQQAVAVQEDLSTKAGAETLFEKAMEAFGRVDVLVNNCGIASFQVFQDLTEETWQQLLAVNLSSAVYLSQLAVSDMLKRHHGRIINISSMWGQVGASCEVAYSTVKAGLLGLTKSLAKEVAPSGITVNCVCPGVIDTPMNACHSAEVMAELVEETPVHRLGTPWDVAHAVGYLVSEEASFVTGQVLGVNGGLVV